jgi:2,3-bisphosphoglycerate-dependent phosphoglycerate mutase
MAGCRAQSQVTTIILLRHAEKGNDGTKDPDLTPEGYQRAQRIVSLLSDTQVNAVYSTNYRRTRNTVQALANARGLDIQTYEPFKPEVISSIVEKHKGKTIVISGHSNTIPWTANLLLGEERFKDFSDTDYDNVLIVSVVEMGKNSVVTWLNAE